MRQSKRHSMIEAVANTSSGYLVSLAVSMWLYPLFGFPVTFLQANLLTGIFTVLSIARNYAVRRVFIWHQHRSS